MDISVVIPAFNEEENIPLIHASLNKALEPLGLAYELIFVDDGSTDGSLEAMRRLKENCPRTKIVHFRVNHGKSHALNSGFRQASGNLIVTIDADGQESPDEIPRLMEALDSGYDMVGGWRQKRRDARGKTLASKCFNKLVHWMTGKKFQDINCGLKIYKKEVVRKLRLYGELHRVIPVLAVHLGFRAGEIPVAHQKRRYGHSKYDGWLRGLHGILDLLTVQFLYGYQIKPMHFFGISGILLFLLGFAISLFLSLRYLLGFGHIGGHMPLFMLGILSMILGFQSFGLGFVGELFIQRNLMRAPEDDGDLLE